jgi:phospholipase/carboxylesterase
MRIDGDAALWAGPSEADSLLLLLHGRGADERDLLPLAERLGVPDRIVALRGPVPSQGGRAWAEATPTPDGDSAVAPAGDAVLDWLDRLPGTAPKRIRVLGFSQGCAVALQLLRSAPDRFERVVMLSGFVAEVGGPADAALAARRPPVFWGRGTIDPVIPAAAIARTRTWLQAHTTLTAREYPMLGHGVAEAELADVAAFLAS